MKIFHRFYEMFLWLKNNETFHRICEEIHRYYEENSFSVPCSGVGYNSLVHVAGIDEEEITKTLCAIHPKK